MAKMSASIRVRYLYTDFGQAANTSCVGGGNQSMANDLDGEPPHAAVMSQLRIPSLTPSQPLAASFSSAAVKQEQRIRFDCLRRVASPQIALRRFDRRPDPLRRVVG